MKKVKRERTGNGDLAAVELKRHVDAIVEFVHAGLGHLLDSCGTYRLLQSVLEPNCCANFEYRFAWSHDCDPDALDINWSHLKKRILKQVVKQDRMAAILSGAKLTAKEQRAYRLELARRDHGYVTAQVKLDNGIDCKWVDFSYVKDSKGRSIYFIEMGDADTATDEDMDEMTGEGLSDWHTGVWNWKEGPLEIYGPFRSDEEAEAWMAVNGAFDDDE
jgi:hypothetical protein